ncbi:hypothetical protein [Paenibacillus terrigena]|uniref:hypothetical protein n=1 Tax=Paenibacillus terrigena TaxID=369333 RepID=UPI00036774AE|nr:hypothetical protein [Paenibacillus terrigena]
MERMTAYIKEHYVASAILLALVFLTVILLGAVDLFTFRMTPKSHMSGNGNPALIFVFILVPLYVMLFGIITMISGVIFRDRFRDGLDSIGMFIVLIVFSVIFAVGARTYADMIFNSLGGWPEDPYSAIYGWGVVNQYTNTAFINVFTYSLGLKLAVMLGYLWAAIMHVRRVNKKKPRH